MKPAIPSPYWRDPGFTTFTLSVAAVSVTGFSFVGGVMNSFRSNDAGGGGGGLGVWLLIEMVES